MKRPLLAIAVGTAALLTGAGAVAATPTAVGPVAVGWWSAARVDPAVPAVAPPDVGAHDLYVAGANALPPVGAPVDTPVAPGPLAVAALSFELPAGTSARQLQLRLAGVHPPAVTLTACRALQSFATTYGGAWQDAPPYDCRDAGTARLGTDGQVVIDGVDRLRRDRDLVVVLVPGPLDRVVVAAPDARTLTVTGSPTGGAPPLPPAAPVTEAPVAPAAPLAGAAAPPLAADDAPAAVPTPGSSAPVVSAPAPAPAATATSATLAARPWPALAATLLLATLVFVPLVRPRRGADAVGERGVGRFRSERYGSVPDLA